MREPTFATRNCGKVRGHEEGHDEGTRGHEDTNGWVRMAIATFIISYKYPSYQRITYNALLSPTIQLTTYNLQRLYYTALVTNTYVPNQRPYYYTSLRPFHNSQRRVGPPSASLPRSEVLASAGCKEQRSRSKAIERNKSQFLFYFVLWSHRTCEIT